MERLHGLNTHDQLKEATWRSETHVEALREAGIRVRQGSYYTPLDVVEKLLQFSLGPRLDRIASIIDLPKILDPSCGTGNFLVIAALQMRNHLVGLGINPEDAIDAVVRTAIYGVDSDAEAIKVCRQSLSSLTSGRVDSSELSLHVVGEDSLTLEFGADNDEVQLSLFAYESRMTWTDLFPEVLAQDGGGFDLVIGNPPFLNQLETATLLTNDALSSLQRNFGSTFTKLTNPSSIFLLISLRLTSAHGSLLMIQPLSFLATSHSQAIRKQLSSTRGVCDIWICTDKVFDANVQVCAVHVDKSQKEIPTRIFSGRNFEFQGAVSQNVLERETWSSILAKSMGYPEISLRETVPLGTIASASAAFRDQYYGLQGAVVEIADSEESSMKLVTVGLIDPATCRWGQVQTRFAKRVFKRPSVLLSRLSGEMRDWATSMHEPKLHVATQSRIIECCVDVVGDELPCVPVITVKCEPSQIWKVAAVLSAPPVSLVAAVRHLGSGISGHVLRVTAKDLLALPLPYIDSRWEEGARLFMAAQSATSDDERTHLLLEMGVVMCEAYEVENHEIFDWWASMIARRAGRAETE